MFGGAAIFLPGFCWCGGYYFPAWFFRRAYFPRNADDAQGINRTCRRPLGGISIPGCPDNNNLGELTGIIFGHLVSMPPAHAHTQNKKKTCREIATPPNQSRKVTASPRPRLYVPSYSFYVFKCGGLVVYFLPEFGCGGNPRHMHRLLRLLSRQQLPLRQIFLKPPPPPSTPPATS